MSGGPSAVVPPAADVDDGAGPWTLVSRRRRRGGRGSQSAAQVRPAGAPRGREPVSPRRSGAGASASAPSPVAARPLTGAGPASPPSRAAAAVAALTCARTGGAPLPALKTLYIAGVSRDARSHGLRRLVADAVDVVAATVVDVDRFGATAAVTVLASATEAFRAGLADSSLAGVFWEVAAENPWSPLFLGSRRRAQLSGPDAAAEAVKLCLRRLRAKLDQLVLRVGMPPHLRAALRAHIGAQIVQCAGQVGAPTHAAVAVDRAAARAPPRLAPAAPRRAGAVLPADTPSRGGRRRWPPHANTAGHPGGTAAPAASGCLPRPPTTRARSGSAPPLASVRAADQSLGRHGAGGLPTLPQAVADLLWAAPLVSGSQPSGVRAARGQVPTWSTPAGPTARGDGADGTPPRRGGPGRALVAPPCTPAVATAGGRGILSLRVRPGSEPPSLPPSPRRPPRSLLAATALAAAVPLPGGGMLFRPRPARVSARLRRPPAPLLVGGVERPRTRAAVAAAAAAAAEARRASLTLAAATAGPAGPAAAGDSDPLESTVSDAGRHE